MGFRRVKYNGVTTILFSLEGFQDPSLRKAFTTYFQLVIEGEFIHQDCPVITVQNIFSFFELSFCISFPN